MKQQWCLNFRNYKKVKVAIAKSDNLYECQENGE